MYHFTFFILYQVNLIIVGCWVKKIIVTIIVIAAVAGGYYYYNLNNTEISTTSYEYIKIEKGNIKKTVSATGKIIPTSTLTLSS